MPLPLFFTLRRERRGGFTLIELLAVICIIGILSAFVIPVTGRVRESARASQCLSNLRQVSIGVQLYVQDHKGSLPGPVLAAQYPSYRQTTAGTKGNLAALIVDYVPARQGATNMDRVQELLACPSWSLNTPDKTGPSMIINASPVGWLEGNAQVYPLGYAGATAEGTRVPLLQLRIQAYPLATTWLMVDADQDWFGGSNSASWFAQLPSRASHGNNRNWLFYDGHVGSVPAQKRPGAL